jgi:hypothetical protein
VKAWEKVTGKKLFLPAFMDQKAVDSGQRSGVSILIHSEAEA